MKKVVYVAGPYSGPTHDGRSYFIISANIMMARECAKKIWKAGAVALCPHLNTEHFELDADLPAEAYYEGDLALLKNCDAIFMMSTWRDSKGAILEKDFAEKRGLPVFYDIEALKAWLVDGEREAATRQQMPTGEGVDVAELVVADVQKHSTWTAEPAMVYQQLLCIAFFLKRREFLRIPKTPITSQVRAEIVKDIEARVAMGKRKYGTRLKTNNGRSAALDLIQEVYDALNYCRQEIEEEKQKASA